MTTDPTLVALAVALAVATLLVFLRPAGRRAGSAQADYVAVEAIEDGVLTLVGGHHRAVLEVGSVNFALLGEERRRELVAGYGVALASLTFPIQILARATPLDLEPYLAGAEARARREPDERLRRLAYDRMAFLRRLAAGRTLLERRFYVVVPADNPRPGTAWRSARPGREDGQAVRAAAARATATRQLAFRCDDLAAQLGRCGLAARRLDDGELAALLYRCWCPTLARSQRLPRDLADRAALVVAARSRPNGEGGAPCP